MRPASKIYEWVFCDYTNRVYAYVEKDYRWWEGLRDPTKVVLPDGRKFVCSGKVGNDDAGWINALFYRPPDPGLCSTHPIRKTGFCLDGRSSLTDIAYGMFVGKVLIELSDVRSKAQ